MLILRELLFAICAISPSMGHILVATMARGANRSPACQNIQDAESTSEALISACVMSPIAFDSVVVPPQFSEGLVPGLLGVTIRV